ncbi:MAG: hypothetical protein ACLU9S_04765 [Oscillospiraceae bacterium]
MREGRGCTSHGTARAPDETARLLRGHCQHFSRLGWALFAQMLSMLLAQAGILLIVGVCAPGLTGNSLF